MTALPLIGRRLAQGGILAAARIEHIWLADPVQRWPYKLLVFRQAFADSRHAALSVLPRACVGVKMLV